MATTLTVTQTTTAVLETYRKDIERAAGDSVLSKAEQAGLTPFAKKYIEQARVTGQKMTVAQAVAALEAPLTRAMKSIAGDDGLVDASEVPQLRVDELRLRTRPLFDESSPSTAALKTAIEAVNVPAVTDWGRSVSLLTFSKNKTVEEITAELAHTDVIEDLDEYATVRLGRSGVNAAVSVLADAGEEVATDAEDAVEGADLRARFEQLADEVKALFHAADFDDLVHVRHAIAEDGDLEVNLLLGRNKRDGTWLVFSHTNYPF